MSGLEGYMVVQIKRGRRGLVGLHLDGDSIHKHFPPESPQIELEMDNIAILCSLEPSFWEDRPEIYDRRLSSWLRAKNASGKLPMHTGHIALIPSGQHTFRLQPLAAGQATDARYPVASIA